MNPTNYIHYEDQSHKDALIAHLYKAVDKQNLTNKWQRVLDNAVHENEIQSFLERYPHFLPGLYDNHNGPRCCVIASKFPFGRDYISDFAFVTPLFILWRCSLLL